MKKILFLMLIFSALIASSANAQLAADKTSNRQPANDPALILQQMKEQQAPLLVEKTGLTVAQAEKVIELNFEMRQQAATALKGLNDADRSQKLAELKAEKEKKFAEFLTAEQIATVKAYYENMGKNTPQKTRN